MSGPARTGTWAGGGLGAGPAAAGPAQYPRELSAVTGAPRRVETYSSAVIGLENIG